jgi:dihydrofolate reductase
MRSASDDAIRAARVRRQRSRLGRGLALVVALVVHQEAMADLIYTAIQSLDGFVADRHGSFDWSAPDEEVHAFVNDLERPIGTYLLGRRMYDVLVAWEDMDTASQTPAIQDFAEMWRSVDKVVLSRTLAEPRSAKTRIEREFDRTQIAAMKAAATKDLSIGGPALAAHAVRAGLVDEVGLFLNPIVVGGGTAALPDDVHVQLELMDERRFSNGVVFLRYRTRT